MPKKIRELKQMLQKAGFTLLSKRGKGSHSYWVHPLIQSPIVLSGKESQDAKPYQEKDVRSALQEIEQLEQENES